MLIIDTSKLINSKNRFKLDLLNTKATIIRRKMDEDKNLFLDRFGKGKTPEQLKKHSIDSNLENRPIDRAMHILTSGDDVQKISVIEALPNLQNLDANSTNNRILPKIQQDLSRCSSEFQVTASRVFKNLIEKQSNTSVLTSVVQGVDSKDPTVASSWCETLISVVLNLSEEQLRNMILPIARGKAAPNNPGAAKIFSSRLIGKICTYPHLKIIDVKKDILPIALGLCQDVSPEVRASICSNLSSIAQGIGASLVKTNLLPSLVELARDENNLVRGSAIVAIAQTLQFLDVDTKKQTMVPLLKQLCEKSMKKDDTTSMILASEYGKLLSGIESSVSQQDVVYFLKHFKTLSERGKTVDVNNPKLDASKEVLCREHCASNVLSVLHFVKLVAPTEVQFVYGIYRELAGDPCYLVRRSIAGTVSSMAKILGEEGKLMKNEIVRLLRDDAIEVLDLLVPNISSTFLSLCDFGALSYSVSNQMTLDIGRALFKCQTELSKGYNWRLTVMFLIQLECLPFCMPADFIHNNFTPVLLDKVMNGKVKPIRIQAIRTLMIFLRYNFKANQSKWLQDTLIKQIAHSENCYTRMLYIHLCEIALEIYSEKYFKEHFLNPLLTLVDDKTSNVRYGFMMFSTKLKQMVTLQTDAKAKQSIMDAINKLETNEKKGYISDVIKIKKKEAPLKKLDNKLQEEARKVREEASCTITRSIPPSQITPTRPATSGPTTASIKSTINRPSQNIIQTGPQKPPQQITEMSILEQHFYTDAGVSLLENKNLIIKDDISTTNMTDDVKVNLRKFSKLVAPKTYTNEHRKKRYSSIYTEKNVTDININFKRRSLNLSGDFSRIPVCKKTFDIKMSDSLAKNNCDKTEGKSKPSNLPVYTRKPMMGQTKK